MAENRTGRRRWITLAAAAACVALTIGVTLTATGAAAPTAGRYRTAVVATGAVSQTLTLSGTVERTNQVTAAFAVSGTVTSVLVNVGDTVRAGQKLATVDTATLRANLLDAQATQAQAQASLASDQAATTTPSAVGRNSGASVSSSAAATQRALRGAQSAMHSVSVLLAQESQQCAPIVDGAQGPGADPADPTDPTDPTVGPGSTPANTTAPSVAQITSCSAAITQTAQALQDAERAVESIVERVLTTTKTTATSPAPSTSTNASRGATGDDSATRIAGDRVTILQDEDAVSQAKTALSDAVLTAPIGGTVAEVGLIKGQDTGADATVVIVGAGSAIVTVAVPLTEMAAVHAGMAAAVTPVGTSTTIAGTVKAVNLLPSSTTGTPTYPGIVSVPGTALTLPSGATATVSLVVGTATNTLRIPVSALAGRTGDSGTVELLGSGAPTVTRVTVGVVGGGWAQILSGVTIGQRVVIADTTEPLPSNTSFGGLAGNGARSGFRSATASTGAGG